MDERSNGISKRENEDESEKKMHFILHHKESREASTSFVVCVATYKHLSKELS